MDKWIMLHPRATQDMLGYLPLIFSTKDERPAREQADIGYVHGGGWNPNPKFTMDSNGFLHYPGDPALFPVAEIQISDETVRLYEHSIVAIIQPDGAFEAARMD